MCRSPFPRRAVVPQCPGGHTDVTAGREGSVGGRPRRPRATRSPARAGCRGAARDDRSGTDGRQPRAAPAARRPRVRRVRPRSRQRSEALAAEGAVAAAGVADLVAQLAPPRAVWLMLPAGDRRCGRASSWPRRSRPDDTIIDGGNSHYRDDLARAATFADRGMHWVDVGTSGGVWGLERGFCLMIGGDAVPVRRLEPIFRSLAPGVGAGAAHARPRRATRSPAEEGWLHCGPPGRRALREDGAQRHRVRAHGRVRGGARHRQARPAPVCVRRRASTMPRRRRCAIPRPTATSSSRRRWRRCGGGGASISSWLLDLTAAALNGNPTLDGFKGRVSDSGEGRWTVQAAVDTGVPAAVITAALFESLQQPR